MRYNSEVLITLATQQTKLILWSTVLPENLIAAQPVKKFPVLYKTRMSISVKFEVLAAVNMSMLVNLGYAATWTSGEIPDFQRKHDRFWIKRYKQYVPQKRWFITIKSTLSYNPQSQHRLNTVLKP
ncbi:hypothetical protein L798_11146 [Zootermopsis nevadensis]|uniref:Uncharacterized protein n=1 Tax=Zootermopsis nevadensis TaxID=136037 RepID=A0A067RL07_ZOONE|nr:hypothetical protein L798_11146 [Zootermopsis nevadensis]